jgi:phosphocarrier protein HPr
MEISKDLEIVNKLGLHLRAAAQFVQTANRFRSDVTVEKDGHSVNGKSIMGVMTLVAVKGSKITVKAQGEDAGACLDALAGLTANKFGEKE